MVDTWHIEHPCRVVPMPGHWWIQLGMSTGLTGTFCTALLISSVDSASAVSGGTGECVITLSKTLHHRI